MKSMTAFAQVSNTYETITAEVTIRSYNSKYLDIAFYCPESCKIFEDDIKKIIAETHDRGRIEIKLFVQDDQKDLSLFEVDEAVAASYYQALKKIHNDFNLSSDICLKNMLTAKNVIVPSKKEHDFQNLWKAVGPCMETASEKLDSMRRKEGQNLYHDLKDRINDIEKDLQALEKEAENIPVIYKQKLMERISKLMSDTKELDPVRIAQEAAILADKSDVSEEIIRLYSHIRQFGQILESDEPQGRKLGFLVQEFNREFNTIGSKAGKASLSYMVVELKSQLEKIREQVQNIE